MDQTSSKGNILMFCVKFFGYENRLARAFEDSGYHVDLFDERPSNSALAKICIRKDVKAYRGTVRRYIESIIEKQKGKIYDYVVVIKGEAINEKLVELLRHAYPDAKFLLYLWDSVCNIPGCEVRMKLYDRVMTFDPEDAKKYHIGFLPIPYGQEQFQIAQQGKLEYDVAFIGTAHSIRPRVVSQVEKICRENGKKCFAYFYSPHILVYWLNRLTNPDYRYIKKRDIHFSSLSPEETYRIYSQSKCVLDIEHPRQHGTTTRPVEMLPMHKKIITTNENVKKFPFYNENNFCIIDRDNPQIDGRFFDLPYVPVDQKILDEYSPAAFVKKLIGNMGGQEENDKDRFDHTHVQQ